MLRHNNDIFSSIKKCPFMWFDTCLSLVILGSKVNVYTLTLCILKKVPPEFFLFYIPNFDHINIFVLTYYLFALSLPTEVIILFIDDVLSCDFDIFQIFVGVGMRAQLVGNHVAANYSLLIVVFWPPKLTRTRSLSLISAQQLHI